MNDLEALQALAGERGDKKAEKSRERRAAANKPAKALYDRLEKIVGTFCPGLAKQPLHIDRFGGGHHHGYGHMPHKH